MEKKIALAIIVCIVVIIYVSINVLGFIFGIGISIPPNECDLKYGYEVGGDLVKTKRNTCLFDKAIEEKSHWVCNFITAPYTRRDCKEKIVSLQNLTE